MARSSLELEEFPDEVLETIISGLGPYEDSESCQKVNKRWNYLTKNALSRRKSLFSKGVSMDTESLICQILNVNEELGQITRRYSHSALYYDKKVWIYGGCASSSTTFNDLWTLRLNDRKWSRVNSMGTYPSPKACSSMVLFDQTNDDPFFILFGGWTNSRPNSFHVSWRLFSELHRYDVKECDWKLIQCEHKPPAMAGHSATSHRKKYMVVFGGLQKVRSIGHFSSSNEVWVLDVESENWEQKEINNPKPQPRYGQSQIKIDEYHCLVMGGCGGPNNVFSDIWLLDMTKSTWQWIEISIKNPQYGASHLWCHSACRVGNSVVVLCKRQGEEEDGHHSARWNVIPHLQRGVNRGYGSIRRMKTKSGKSVPRQISDPLSNASGSLKNPKIHLPPPSSFLPGTKFQKLSFHVLDISNLLTNKTVVWKKGKPYSDPSLPDETILYTLVQGRSELIMFGGIRKEASKANEKRTQESVSNSTYFFQPKLTIF